VFAVYCETLTSAPIVKELMTFILIAPMKTTIKVHQPSFWYLHSCV